MLNYARPPPPQKTHPNLNPWNLTSFGNSVFLRCIKDLKMRISEFEIGLPPNDQCPYKTKEREIRDMNTEEKVM